MRLAAATWRRIGLADGHGLNWSEETITETNLLELADLHPNQVAIEAVTKRREALIGADWEWWLGGGGSWFGMRVQAKRVSLPNERFGRILSQRARGRAETQIRTLIERAHLDGVTPAYCLYVHSARWPRLGYWPDRYMGAGEGTPLGCLMAHASVVSANGSNELESIAAYALPWHLLANVSVGGSLAGQAYEAMSKSCWAHGVGSRMRAGPDHPDWPLFNPVSALPVHARYAVHRALGTVGANDAEPFEGEMARRALSGIAVIRSSPFERTDLDR
jgi:hypothetical protein